MSQASKRVLAVHDLSGFGHTSLMAAIAILYRLGIRVAALPTSLLSANTDHEGYSFHAFDAGMREFIRHWQQLGMRFDAVYTGFLGNPGQVEIILDGISQLAGPDTLVLVDPVLGDAGRLYGCYDAEMVKAMRKLAEKADLITPNVTEAALLLDETPDDNPDRDWRGMAVRLSETGPSKVVISSIPSSDPRLKYCGAFDASKREWKLFPYVITPGAHPGSGDCFASFLLAGIMNGYGFMTSTHAAVEIMSLAIGMGEDEDPDWREGIRLEKLLCLDLMKYYNELCI